MIDTQDEPVITGLVFVNGDLVARIPLFDLVLNSAPEVSRSRNPVVADVDVLLSAEAAGALNSVFGIDDFTAGLPIGEGTVKTKLASERRSKIDDNEGDDQPALVVRGLLDIPVSGVTKTGHSIARG